jgi:hypothetical protein
MKRMQSEEQAAFSVMLLVPITPIPGTKNTEND